MAFFLAQKLNFSSTNIANLGYDISAELKNTNPTQAAQILVDYCRDNQAAFDVLIEAKEWQQALLKVFFSQLF